MSQPIANPKWNLGIMALLGVTLLLAGEARADVTLSAQSVVVSPPVIEDFSFDRTIDQSGLSIGYVSGVTDFHSYVGSSPIHIRNNTPPNYSATFSTPPRDVDYDLGSTYGIATLAFWNYPFESPGGVTGFQVYTSGVSNFSTSFLAGMFAPINDGDGNTNEVQVFDLADSNARYVRLRITGSAGGNGFGFSEIAFGIVPEPSSLALLLVAASLVGASARRWRQ